MARDLRRSLKDATDRLSNYDGLPESQQIQQRMIDLEVNNKNRRVPRRCRKILPFSLVLKRGELPCEGFRKILALFPRTGGSTHVRVLGGNS